MPQLARDGEIFVLDLGDGENRFDPGWVAGFDEALGVVAATPGPRALVTCATGKFWSNGLDLSQATPGCGFAAFLISVHHLFARVLALPVPTVAAIQGHCFAAGAVAALAHDFRVMRADRGFFCLPEIDIQLAFTPGMSALIQARLPVTTAHTAMTTGRRYGGHDALAAGIVDEIADEGKVLDAAVAMARPLAGKAGPTLGAIKAVMYRAALRSLRDDAANAGNLAGPPAGP
jgi:enoyl-CoA hydratase/carnithine racemase